MFNRNLLIIGAGIYALVASEIAADMGCFSKVDFLDDEKNTTQNGLKVLGTVEKLSELVKQYSDVVVAIGNPDVRSAILKKVEKESQYTIATLISPKAYISPTAQILEGCIIEPMAVVQSNCKIAKGCIISAGAVVNHGATCLDIVHIDCNATVVGGIVVPPKTVVASSKVYDGK